MKEHDSFTQQLISNEIELELSRSDKRVITWISVGAIIAIGVMLFMYVVSMQ